MEREVGRFRLGAFIGRGASGDVYEGADSTTGQRVAVKCVDCRRFRSIAELEAVQEEAALLSTLRHRYIVRLLAVHVTSSHMYFAMEHAGGGTLQQLLRAKEGGQLGEAEALRIFLQICQALEYCHRRCVVHRDLKPENILLTMHGDVKVADFGLASILTPFDGSVSTIAGTPEFIAPELLAGGASGLQADGAMADLWSLGVMLYEALAGRTPFSGVSLAAILRAALRHEYAPLPPEVSPECRDLVAALLQPDPQRRISLEEALQHPWLRRGLQHLRELSPLPSEEEAEVERAAAPGQQGQEGQGGAAQANSPEPPAGGQSRPGSARGPGGAAGLRRCASAGRLVGEHSSLTLQLPGGPPVAAEFEPLAAVPEEASQRSLSRSPSRLGSRPAMVAGESSSRPGSPAGSPTAGRLARGRSAEGSQRRLDASPKAGESFSRVVKAASSKTFSISARADGKSSTPTRRSQA